jgi:hypothetical protein
MASLLSLKTFTDSRGNLTVIEKSIPFDIKRIFYIYGVDDSVRGQHRHKITYQAALSLQGACTIYNHDGQTEKEFRLDSPDKCLLLSPTDWHKMYHFTPNCILMVLASTHFDPNDYIFTPYL